MALAGLRVIEFAGLAPVPYCGMILANFGASVLRIDKNAVSSLDVLANGKKSIALDLKKNEAVTIIKKLCRKSDVILEPFRPGVMEKLGLGPNELLKENDKLIYARLTGFGQSGYYSNRAGHDINYLSLSGLLSLFGRANDKPLFPINLAADFGGGGLMCAMGILLALIERSTSGKGQVIDASMVEGCLYLGSWLYRSQSLPMLWGKSRGENVLDTGSHFYEVYQTKDNLYMAVGAIEPQFYAKLLKGLGFTYEEVPQFENFEKNKELFTKRFLEKTQKEWCDVFDEIDACVTPVLSLEDATKHLHNIQRKSFTKSDGQFVPNPAPKLSRTPGQSLTTHSPPDVGEHTLEILKDLNYEESQIHKLIEDGVIGVSSVSSKL